MATGIEMLGEMATDQSLAGPVQGGNMVVKPDQVPVGGAAMLAKALRGQANKGVGGMYVLPEQQDQTPDFMKIAQSNVMRDIEGQRNQYPMNYAENEGGIIPMLPRNLKTAPGADETTLAYITPEEQAILGLLNPGTPHMGPEQVPSYDSYDYGVQTTSEDWSGYDTGQSDAPKAYTQARERAATDKDYAEQYGGGTQQQAQAEIAKEKAQGGGKYEDYLKSAMKDAGTTTEAVDKQNETEKELVTKIEKAVEDGNTTEIEKLANEAKTTVVNLGSLIKNLTSKAGSVISGIFDFDKGDKKEGKDSKKKKKNFIEDLLSGGAFGTLMDKISKPTEESFKDNNYKAIMKDKYFNEDGSFKEGMEKDFKRFEREYSDIMEESGAINPNENILSMKDVLMSGQVAEGSDLERRLNPTKYWEENKPATGQDFKDMAQAQREGKLAFTKANTQAIEEGRRLLEQEGGGGGGGRPRFMDAVEEEVIETPTGVVDEEAQTMAYTSPRTGGVETQVPLQRRFKTDPTKAMAQYTTTPRTQEDIYKYMTEGTTGEGIGLEPFSEYQKRRRKALGLEPLGLWS